MKIYSHENLSLHRPLPYFSYGKMHEPLEIPERMVELLKAPVALGLEVTTATDVGIAPILAVHDFGYVEFLKHGYDEWMAVEEDLGAQVQTGIFVPYDNPGIGIMAKAAKYQADDSAPISEHSWTSIYWSAQTALNAAEALLNNKATDTERAQSKTQLCFSRPPGHHARKSAAGGFAILIMLPSSPNIYAKSIKKSPLSTPTCITDKVFRRCSTTAKTCFILQYMVTPLIFIQQ